MIASAISAAHPDLFSQAQVEGWLKDLFRHVEFHEEVPDARAIATYRERVNEASRYVALRESGL